MNLRTALTLFPRDSLAGVVVFLVALPLCLGIANASGVPPFAGLVAGVIGGIAVTLLSGSPLSVSGPAAGLIVIVTDGIATLGGFRPFLLAVLLAGVLQFGFGVLRAGRFAAYIPSSVIKGMLAAIGLLLIFKQLPFALGMNGFGADHAFGPAAMVATAIAAVSLVLLAAWDTRALRRYAIVRVLPGPLAVVMLGIAATLVLAHFSPHLGIAVEQRVALPALDSLAALGGALERPDFGAHFSQLLNPDVWRVALALAVIASLETLLSLEAVEQIDPLHRPVQPNRELKAQGVGNVLAGALGGLPITSVIVRSAVNVEAGARSRLSTVVHALLLLAIVFALTGVLNLIPLASLAAILIHTGAKLAKPKLFISVAKQGLGAFLPFVATIGGVLAVDLLFGIAAGLAASIAAIALANLRSPMTLAHHGDHYLLTFRKDVWFLGKVKVKHLLAQIPEHAEVTIDATRADYIDHDVQELLDAFIARAPARGMTVEFRRQPRRERNSARHWVMHGPHAQ